MALFCAYPVTVHLARPATAVVLLAALLAYVAASFLLGEASRWLAPPLAAGLFFFAEPAAGEWALFAPPVAVNAGLCWLFGRTLVRGRAPLISRFARMEQETLTAELAAYTRALTWIWTVLFAGAACVSLALAMSGRRDAWSWFNFVNYVLVAALFLGEIAYRRIRFPNYRHASALELLRNVRRAGLFER